MTLTPREHQLLSLIAQNRSTAEMALAMGLRKTTIQSMKYTLRRKGPPEIKFHDGLYEWAKQQTQETA